MSDFIKISCPSCGGMLNRGASITTYTCNHCGQQHHLRVEDIEESGRCPVCQRKNRSEIMRALYNKGDNLSKHFASPHKPEDLRFDPKAKPDPMERPTITNTATSTATLTPTLDSLKAPRGDGFYRVDSEFAPGVWDSDGTSDSCYWEVSNRLGDIICNYFGLAEGTAHIPSGAFQVLFQRCELGPG